MVNVIHPSTRRRPTLTHGSDYSSYSWESLKSVKVVGLSGSLIFDEIDTSFQQFCLKIGTHIVFDRSKVRAAPYRGISGAELRYATKRCQTEAESFVMNLATIATNMCQCTNFQTKWLERPI